MFRTGSSEQADGRRRPKFVVGLRFTSSELRIDKGIA